VASVRLCDLLPLSTSAVASDSVSSAHHNDPISHATHGKQLLDFLLGLASVNNDLIFAFKSSLGFEFLLSISRF